MAEVSRMTDKNRHPARRSRIVAFGIGLAAMAGLVGNMQVANGRAKATDPSPSPTGPAHRAAAAADRAGAQSRQASASRPIVLTPHAVVRSVATPASGGSGSSGRSGYAAPAPAAVPVATTSGSG
jgi:hypothetical protein